ncbi:glycerol-3-phosphate dehydrogenase C-terminal domain-containing protein, partial [Photobacterium sanctipauli]
LPGGEAGFNAKWRISMLTRTYPWMPALTAERLVTNYGSRTEQIMAGVRGEADMGEHFGEGFYARELDYLVEHEFVCDAQDALWRRSKLGLYLNESQQQAVADYLDSRQRLSIAS